MQYIKILITVKRLVIGRIMIWNPVLRVTHILTSWSLAQLCGKFWILNYFSEFKAARLKRVVNVQHEKWGQIHEGTELRTSFKHTI